MAMRSRAGVGMTPPKVLGAPKPTSSVMMSSTFGAPLGGTTRGGHHGFDWAALRLITPPNFGSGGGRYLPSMVAVAPGEPRGAAPGRWLGGDRQPGRGGAGQVGPEVQRVDPARGEADFPVTVLPW